MTEKMIRRLKELIEKKALEYGNFTLASGIKVGHYFDVKKVLLNSEGSVLTGMIVFNLVAGEGVKAIGGEGMGGRAIVGAVVPRSYLEGKPIPGFEILKREELREDDPQRYKSEEEHVIKGLFPSAGNKVALVEDTLSTGGSIFRAIAMVEKNGCEVAIIIAILDRQLGGSEELLRRGYNFKSLLRADSSGNVYIN